MNPSAKQPATIRLFCSYAHDNESFRNAFEKALASLKRTGLVDIWSPHKILAGADVKASVDAALDSAHIIVLLVSNSFFDSDNCWGHEMLRAKERHSRREARLVPVLVEPCLWEDTPIATLKPLPTDAKPVTSWENQADAWKLVAVGIHEVVKDIQFEALRRTVPESVRDKPTERNAQIIRIKLDELAKLSTGQIIKDFSAEELIQLGNARYVSGDIDEATRLYHKAIAAAPENALGWHRLAFAIDEGYRRYDEALRYYDVALALDPTLVEAHVDRSYVLRQLGRLSDSIDATTSALKLEVSNARAAYNRACSSARNGNKFEALASLAMALKLNPIRYAPMASEDLDFRSINTTPEFRALVETAKQKPG